MTTLTKRLRMLLIVVLGCIQMFSFPISFEEEVTSPYSSETETVHSRMDPQSKPLARKTPSFLQRLIMLASALPLLFVMPLVLLLRLPKPRLPFIPVILIRKKYLLLLPIKYTSSYLV
ncbi:hypothetical protein P4H66_21785 [Paenibacillus dokdonensis]|uniref:Uncharacterized protein n=1 Tax=Paenibacillus dokdonensis TaxID=2567944 RepID=A0ABU6GRQ7_9BACL|nr:hypothetical protein [Paenibacillus dokdonensis]MEC0242445.1 hypothetical protein [Paenibacillus dokdonensis]